MTTSEWIQVATLVVLGVTVVGVFWYAWEARKQAKASAYMAKEMREQRLAEDEPWLILDITDQKFADYHEWDEQSSTLRHKVTREELRPWPLPECNVRVHNAGRGAAVSVEACYLQDDNHYFHSARGFLLRGESATFEISGLPAPFVGRSPWATEALRRLGPPKPALIVAGYQDVHGRSWVSYIDLDWHEAMVPLVFPLGQGRLRLGDHPEG